MKVLHTCSLTLPYGPGFTETALHLKIKPSQTVESSLVQALGARVIKSKKIKVLITAQLFFRKVYTYMCTNQTRDLIF